MSPGLKRQTIEVLAHRGLNLQMARQAIAWGWALIDEGLTSDAVFVLTAQTPEVHWGELNSLVDRVAAELSLARPADEATATRWLAALHLRDILAAGGDDFTALKKVSRLWFDHQTPDLHRFYRLKHAIREVETSGTQGHWPGLTRDNWRTILSDEAARWLAAYPLPL